jgi:hypothetical protein
MRIVATLTIAAAFCFQATAQNAPAGQSPCALVTRAEVQEAAGVSISEGALNKTNKLVCDFKAGATGSLVSVLLTTKGPADSAARTAAELNKQKIAATVVTGIGDGAYAASPGYGMQQLGAYKGTKHVVVTVFLMGTPEAKAKATAEAVMRKALTRI